MLQQPHPKSSTPQVFPTTFTLKRVGGDSRPENMPILTDGLPANPFPLNDAEWNHHLRPPGDLTLSAK